MRPSVPTERVKDMWELLLPSVAPESAADGIQVDSGRVPAS
ncbi:hypothetical protein [Streptomyces sp. NPDC058299]